MNDPDCTDKDNWLYEEFAQNHRQSNLAYPVITGYQKAEIRDADIPTNTLQNVGVADHASQVYIPAIIESRGFNVASELSTL
jgi:hypothetical protein